MDTESYRESTCTHCDGDIYLLPFNDGGSVWIHYRNSSFWCNMFLEETMAVPVDEEDL